jgi:hypothetical protein
MTTPAPDRKSLTVLLAVGVLASSLSGVAILLYWLSLVNLSFATMVCLPLTVVLLGVILAAARPARRRMILQRMGAGLFAGLLGLVAYDGIRWLLMVSGVVPANPFRVIEVFGLLIMQSEIDTVFTKCIGWAFHVWNGLTFAMMYTLALGRGRIRYAVVWSVALEGAMLVTYPSAFHVVLNWPFVTISLVGHLAFGGVVGWAARGAVRE